MEVMRTTDFAQGLYDAVECDSEQVKEKESKMTAAVSAQHK